MPTAIFAIRQSPLKLCFIKERSAILIASSSDDKAVISLIFLYELSLADSLHIILPATYEDEKLKWK